MRLPSKWNQKAWKRSSGARRPSKVKLEAQGASRKLCNGVMFFHWVEEDYCGKGRERMYRMIRDAKIWYDVMVWDAIEGMWWDETRWDIMRYNEIWWDMMRHDETWWNMMRYDETRSDIMNHDNPWGDMVRHAKTWWDMMRPNETCWNIMRHEETWGDMMRHDETWWDM